jgi:hypothetical protein
MFVVNVMYIVGSKCQVSAKLKREIHRVDAIKEEK